jgi:hypothetical protein
MATKWIDEFECLWCESKARVGIEKDGTGNTCRVMCSGCGAMTQVAKHYPAGKRISQMMNKRMVSQPGKYLQPFPLILSPGIFFLTHSRCQMRNMLAPVMHEAFA